jgi:DNA-binding transcriptional LysR family regulator
MLGSLLTFDTTSAVIDAALSGYGIGYVAEDFVQDHIAAGRLVQVLDVWLPKFAGYHFYYPTRRQNSAAFTVIVNTLRENTSSPAVQEVRAKGR